MHPAITPPLNLLVMPTGEHRSSRGWTRIRRNPGTSLASRLNPARVTPQQDSPLLRFPSPRKRVAGARVSLQGGQPSPRGEVTRIAIGEHGPRYGQVVPCLSPPSAFSR